jgi:hypothetical protein
MPDTIALPTLPPLEALLSCAAAALCLAVVLAACFGPVLAVVSERLGLSRRRGFYAKAARQIGQMAFLLGLLAAAALAVYLSPLLSGDSALLAFPYRLPFFAAGGSVVLTLLFLALYMVKGPQKGPSGAGHILLGLLAGFCAMLSLLLCTGFLRRLVLAAPDMDPTLLWSEQLLRFFEIPRQSLFWPLLLESVPLGFAFAAAFAAVWLCIMRGRQDFGRDYYAFALPYCAGWARAMTLLAIPAGAFALFRSRDIMLPELSRLPSLLLDALSVILPLAACLLWTSIIRSEHPMRRKISAAAACVLLLAGFAGQVLMLNKIIPSP